MKIGLVIIIKYFSQNQILISLLIKKSFLESPVVIHSAIVIIDSQ